MESERVIISLSNSQVVVALHGATVISWKHRGDEKLFVSEKAVFDGKKAIRGGIPVIFPNFGPWECGAQHGFARVSRWTCSQQPTLDSESCTAVFTLDDSEDTRKMWNYKFRVDYTVCLRNDCLETTLDIYNTGTTAFDFTCLLHTYLRVADITTAGVRGLNGASYIDKVRGGSDLKEGREVIRVSENEDRVYCNTGDQLQILQKDALVMSVDKTGFPDAVLWNPWSEKAAAMSDMDDEEYRVMLCVEPGAVSNRVQLQPGANFTAKQVLTAKL